MANPSLTFGVASYLTAVVAILNTNLATLGAGVNSIENTIDYENEIPPTSEEFPFIMADIGDPGSVLDPADGNLQIRFALTILIMVEVDNQKTGKYEAARPLAWNIEKSIRGFLRHVQDYDEPESIVSSGGPMNIGDRSLYSVVMSIETTTPEIDPPDNT